MPPRRPWELATLVVCWLVFTLLVAAGLWLAARTGDWRLALHHVGILGLWATLTVLLARRLWPRSRLVAALADSKRPQLEQPVEHGGLIIVGVLVGAAVLVLVLL